LNLKYLNKSVFGLYLLTSSFLYADISGIVFQDLPVNGKTVNSYGVKNANEIGVEGVTVTIFPGGATTTTASDGTWSLAVANGTEVRVEFSGWPSYLRESADGGGGFGGRVYPKLHRQTEPN